jgi:hypothetical protein
VSNQPGNPAQRRGRDLGNAGGLPPPLAVRPLLVRVVDVAAELRPRRQQLPAPAPAGDRQRTQRPRLLELRPPPLATPSRMTGAADAAVKVGKGPGRGYRLDRPRSASRCPNRRRYA